MTRDLEDFRDELISKAREGKITPIEAEAQAKAVGLPPLAFEPDLSEFDPMKEASWPIVKAVAWIAWRDPQLVMEQGDEFRRRCTHWVFREWQRPTSEQTFSNHSGWFLEPWPNTSSLRLSLVDTVRRSTGRLPASSRLTPDDAIAELWRALAEGRLVAEGFDRANSLVEVPAREWSRLELFECNERDVPKYDALDPDGPYHDIQLRRIDVTGLWPRHVALDVDLIDLGNIIDVNMEPMAGYEAYVPLSVALCWVITECALKNISLRDETAWERGVRQLMPKICDGSIEIIGRDYEQIGKPLPCTAFDSVEVPHPLDVVRSLFNSPTHIQCFFYTGADDWMSEGGDQFFPANLARPKWTHLKVRRTEVLAHWPNVASSEALLDTRQGTDREPSLPGDMTSSQQRVVPNSLVFALDETRRRVVFADGPILEGRHFDLIGRLAMQYRADRASLKLPENFEYVPTRKLMDDLRIQEHALGQRVRRIRKDLGNQYSAINYEVGDQRVIQSNRWKGYRLNPYLWLVELSQLVGKCHDTNGQKS